MEGVDELVSSLVDRSMELDEVGLADKENLTRFMEETDTEDFIDKMKNPNTSRKTTGDVKLFTNYLRSVGEMRRIENILPEELNSYLARFYLNVRKQDRTEYEPDTFKTYQSGLSRYLGEKRYGVNILTDLRFKHSRDVLSTKRKELKCLGKSNKQRQADAQTNEVSLLYSKRQLGTGSPTSLINTMWWNNTVHFGLRSRQEHISMRWGDVELMVTSTGEEYLQYSERATKTRTGVTSATRPFPPKMFALPGAFLIPYIFFILFCGIPLFYVEAAIAQYSGKSAYNVWEICPLLKGLGIGIFIMMFVICSYYNMISAWILYYFVNSFINPLPWMSCNNDWNTPYCSDGNHATNITDIHNSSVIIDNNATSNSNLYLNHSFAGAVTPEEEFWSIHILDLSSGIHDVGNINWYLVACLAVAWIGVYLAILLGVKSVGKVVYVTALSPYILLTIILIRGVTLPGSMDGIVFYLKPDFTKLRDFKVWMEAAVQMFYSLGPGWGGIITLACHNKFNNKFNRDAIFVSLAGEGTSIFGGFVTFSILGYMAFKLNVPVSKVAKTGPGLIFIAYPEALGEIPIPNLWAVLFFLTMLFVGLDSQFVQLETIMAVVEDAKPMLKKRKYRVVLRGVLCLTLFLIGLLFCTQGGIYFFQVTDWYICSLFPFVIGILECVIVAWIYGIDRFDSDVKAMLGKGAPKFILFAICFVTPTLLSGVFLTVLIMYKPPTYGTYNYTEMAIGCGWIIGLSPVFAVLVVAVYTAISANGTNLKEKLKNSVTPSKAWTQVSLVDDGRKSGISSLQFWKLKFQNNK